MISGLNTQVLVVLVAMGLLSTLFGEEALAARRRIPSVSLSANPTTIAAGQSSTLAYSSSNATSCVGTGFVASGTSGSVVVNPSTTTTYSITCSNSYGSASASSTVTVSSSSSSSVIFYDDYSSYSTGSCLSDGKVIGPWISTYNGYGCNKFVSSSQGNLISEAPAVSTSPGVTHASLFNGPTISGDAVYEVSMKTVQQLRTGSTPNPWEVAWFLWNYTDDVHFYSLNLKPNGWELGKEDPAFPGAQRYLATGSSPSFPIGQWYNVKVIQIGNQITIYVNGVQLTSVVDSSNAYTSGRIGLYNEDSSVLFGPVKVSTP